MTTAAVVGDLRAELGEGPVWDHRIGKLAWVDIKGKQLLVTDPVSGATDAIPAPSEIGSIALRQSGGYVAALDNGFWAIDDTGWHLIAPVEAERVDLRFNDGKCDPSGRFWAGSMAHDNRVGAGSLYRLESSGRVTTMLREVTISNGLAWSQDASVMFYIDSTTQRVDSFEFDLQSGEISRRSPIVSIPAEDGMPDGMAIDADGGLWVALWDGGCVNRYVEGQLDQTIRVPVSRPTSCAFGGPALDQLFITSAWNGLTEASRADEPLAGALFVANPGVSGRPSVEFVGQS